MIYFESERLLFRGWKPEDLPVFREMNEDPDVMRFFPKLLSWEETDAFYQRTLTEFQAEGYGLFAVEMKRTKEFIGFIGFHKATFPAPFTPCTEIGWRLKASAWGQGFATEGASACLNYGFHELRLQEVVSFTAKINTPSENVMKKIGMLKSGEFDHPNVPVNSPLRRHVLYRISK